MKKVFYFVCLVWLLNVVVFVYVVFDILIKYLIVFVYGIFGFDDVLGVDYFYKVFNKFICYGVKVYIVIVLFVNFIEVCGEQLLVYVQEVLVYLGVEKVNLIGYSYGGLII